MIKRGLVLNPVLGKEFRSRMRTWKSPLVVSVYLGILALIAVGYYWTRQTSMVYSGFGPDVGPQMYVALAIFQLLLVSFVTPAFTAGVISGERERQTLDLLTCTRLSSASIVLNKLLASISYIVLLIVASLPVFGVVYFFGGVLLQEIGQAFVVYLMTALTFGAIGVFCSSIFRRTQVSVVVTYIIVFFFLVGTVALGVFLANMNMRAGDYSIPIITYLNPVVALCSTFPGQFQGGLPSLFGMFGIGGRYGRMSGSMADMEAGLAPWQYNFIGDGIIVVVLLIITIIIITPVGRFGGIKRLFRRKKTTETETDTVDIS
ncbi:MAG: ABC transporter permease [Syntrophothermaceae bacterium]